MKLAAPGARKLVTSGLPVTVHYSRLSERLITDRVVVRRQVSTTAPPTVIERNTTITNPPVVIEKPVIVELGKSKCELLACDFYTRQKLPEAGAADSLWISFTCLSKHSGHTPWLKRPPVRSLM